ncbi:MAG: hypothetical protein GX557_02415 [Chloroflexi bacterium]|nr:hypothetical protein [Chloroflexota bacterium]
MNKKNAGIALCIAGIVIVAIALLADSLGIGGTAKVIGFKQIIGAVIGVIIAAMGVLLGRSK